MKGTANIHNGAKQAITKRGPVFEMARRDWRIRRYEDGSFDMVKECFGVERLHPVNASTVKHMFKEGILLPVNGTEGLFYIAKEVT